MQNTEVFTPRTLKGVRYEIPMSEVEVLDGSISERKVGLKAIVRIKGELMNVYGAQCNIKGCNCDAIIEKA